MIHRRQMINARPGFSLIELVLVIAIMGAVAAMAAPRYAGAVERYRAESAAKRIAADLTLVQTRARQTATSRTITFDVSSNCYTLVNETALDNSSSYRVDLAADPYCVSIATVNFAGNPSLSFNGYGVPIRDGTIQLRSGSAIKVISVEANSGVITVQ